VSSKRVKTFLLACLFLTFAPLLIFTNLHIAHTYYQAGNQIFLLMALAGSAGTLLDQASQRSIQTPLVIAALTLVIIANLQAFYTNDWPRVQKMNSDKLSIGKMIQSATPSDTAILVFGNDWSSTFAYHSQRRAFTRPAWPDLNLSPTTVLRDATQIVGGLPVGAVVSKQPISAKTLAPSCPTAQHRVLKRWHIYLCEPVNAPQP
jgi:hypothetical protein